MDQSNGIPQSKYNHDAVTMCLTILRVIESQL